MTGEGTPERPDKGVPAWVPITLVAAALAVVAVVVSLLFGGSDDPADPTLAGETTSTTTFAPETTQPSRTSTSSSSTTSTLPETTTTSANEAAWAGWWDSVDTNGGIIDLELTTDSGFTYWNSASDLCQVGDARFPITWSGVVSEEGSTLLLEGSMQCYLYGSENPEPTALDLEITYDASVDTIEFPGDGLMLARSEDLPGVATAADNPLIGSWTATDGDGTFSIMHIHADGSWTSDDTRSGGCEAKGYTYARWSAEGSGAFDLTGQPTFRLQMTTYCSPPGGNQVVHSPSVDWTLLFDEGTDTVLLVESQGTTYTRFP